MHLAEFNIGVLKHDWDDPRVADFQNNLERVFKLAERSPGYVWHMPEEEMEAAQLDTLGPIGGNPRTASTLSVWEDGESLKHFVWNTVHKKFYDRRAEWYDPEAQPTRLVMWWVSEGHRPTIAEAAERLKRFTQLGNTVDAFGWDGL